eukprot:jgi/Tetstr1/440685/TSEL_028993.t1
MAESGGIRPVDDDGNDGGSEAEGRRDFAECSHCLAPSDDNEEPSAIPPVPFSPTNFTSAPSGISCPDKQLSFDNQTFGGTGEVASVLSRQAAVSSGPRTLTLGGLAGPQESRHPLEGPSPRLWRSNNMACPYEAVSELKSGKKGSVWYSLPEGIFSDMLLRLQVDEVRSVRLMCREWRWTTRRALTSLRPRKLPSTRILHAFPFLKLLDLDRCSRQLRDGDLEQVQRLSSLTALNLLSCENISDTGLEALLPLTSLASLCLQCCTLLTDRAVAILCRMPNMTALNIGHVPGISDAGLEELARGMPKLRSLSLQACSNITDAGMGALSRMPKLTTLTISRCTGITDAGLAALQPLAPTLVQLELGMCSNLTHKGLHALQHLSNLTTLNLSSCKVNDLGLACLGALPHLSSLNLSTNASITGGGLTALASPQLAATLTSLDLSLCMHVTKDSLAALRSLRSLTQLNLHRCEVGDDMLSMIGSSLPCMTNLDLSNCNQLGDAGLQALGKLPSLRELNLQQCNNLSSEGLLSLQSLSSLTTLNVSHVNQVDDAAAEGFGHLTQLQTLDMTWCARVSSKGAQSLAQLRQLTWLSLAHCYQISDETCRALAHLTQLTHLDLSMCHQVGDKGLGCLDSLSQLRWCKLMGLWMLTDAGVSLFIRNVPSTTFLDVRKCERISPQIISADFRDKHSSLRYILSDRY